MWGLAMLFFVPATIHKWTMRLSLEYMIQRSLDNSAFYEMAILKGVILVKAKTSDIPVDNSGAPQLKLGTGQSQWRAVGN
jgi:hypothetical protein